MWQTNDQVNIDVTDSATKYQLNQSAIKSLINFPKSQHVVQHFQRAPCYFTTLAASSRLATVLRTRILTWTFHSFVNISNKCFPKGTPPPQYTICSPCHFSLFEIFHAMAVDEGNFGKTGCPFPCIIFSEPSSIFMCASMSVRVMLPAVSVE